MTQEEQIARFKEGFPALDIVAAATPERGITRLDQEGIKEAVAYCQSASVAGRAKFVPASGAASRMFKDVFAHKSETISTLADNLEKFAFYDKAIFGVAPHDPVKTADTLLGTPGLGYGTKPKGVLKFHSYPDEKRTALAEHLVEGAEYMRNDDGSVNLIFTISPEHRTLFEQVGTSRIEAFPGVLSTLRTLHAMGCTLAVATSRGHASVVELCARLSIAPYIRHVLAADDVQHSKPHPEAVLRLQTITGVLPERTWVIGDTTFDVDMGHAAQALTIAVTYGNHTPERLASSHPHHIVHGFEELLPLIVK